MAAEVAAADDHDIKYANAREFRHFFIKARALIPLNFSG
jgi:hypothetical protein